MRPTTLCNKCNKEISNNNFKKHASSCTGPKHKKIRGIDYDPNGGYKTGDRLSWNKGKTKETDNRIQKASDTLKNGYLTGKNKPTGCCSTEYLNSEKAKIDRIKSGGYRERAGRSKKHSVYDSFGNLVTLQSSYELATFEILCELGINWVRPKALKYNNRNYFADFYLVDFDVFLDPKNDFKITQDLDKINAVIEQNNVKVFILRKTDINKEFISRII